MTKWWSDTVSGVTESAEVLQALVKTRSSWFPARWVGGEVKSGSVFTYLDIPLPPDCVRLQLQIQNQHSPPVYFHSMCAKS